MGTSRLATPGTKSGTGRAGRAAVLSGLLFGLPFGLLAGAAPSGAAVASTGSAELSQAKHELLVKADLPTGWTAQGSATTSNGGGTDSFPGANQLASCLGVSSRILNLSTPMATSPTFQNTGGTDTVQDAVSVYPSAKFAGAGYKAISSPKVPSCLAAVLQGPAKQQLSQSFGQGVTVGTISVTPAKAAMLVPHSSGFTMSFPVTTKGVSLTATVTVLSMVQGALGTQVTLSAAGLPFPTALAHHLVSVADSRG